MANNNSQNTSNSQQIQYNSFGVPIQPQQVQPRDKTQQVRIFLYSTIPDNETQVFKRGLSSLESEKRQKKGTPKRKSMENEREKHKAEYEKSGLKSLLTQFGSKAKAVDELERDAQNIRTNISALMSKVQSKVNKPIQVTPPPPTTQHPQPQMLQLPATEQPHHGFFTSSMLNKLTYIILFPFNFLLDLIRSLYSSINWTMLLFCVLLMELTIIGLIWTVKRSQNTYLYVEPYEPVVHGTFGVDQSMSLGIVCSVVNSIRDFVAEVMNGGRGFGSPSYDGFVPI
ncbi:11943_t:CDS:2 [Funneliformis caledonium]|uniref:11943_t:CDS:1 n=1 Tax=Funneliformis caledonium TaxID=1117310 RepID=A0A9N8W7X6_9GLOM|nr:11943_t:CDS:2 [Funneliformis caledonium]